MENSKPYAPSELSMSGNLDREILTENVALRIHTWSLKNFGAIVTKDQNLRDFLKESQFRGLF